MAKVTKTFSENKKGKLHEIVLIAEIEEESQDLESYDNVIIRHYIDGRIIQDDLKTVLESMDVWETLIDSINWRELYRSSQLKEVA